MPPQYIFTIEKLSKAFAKKEVLKNIWLSFYPAPRSASSGGTDRAKARSCGSWQGSTKTSSAQRDRRRGPRSAMCPRSRRSTQAGTFAATSNRPWPRCGTTSTGLMRSTRGWARGRTPTRWTNCSRNRPTCRMPSRPRGAGTSTAGSRLPWTPCGYPQARPTSAPLRRRAPAGGALQSAARASRHPLA